MNVAFVDLYQENANPHKDPISTPIGLQANGHKVTLISRVPTITKRFQVAGLTVLPAPEMADRGWRSGGFDAVIAISRFDPAMTPMLHEIKKAGIPLVVKGDTDGTIGYPLTPNYLRMRPLLASPGNILRHLKWRLPIRYWVSQKLAHAQLADRIIVESPGAAVNLTHVLRHWGLASDVRKIRILTNHVSQVAIDLPIQSDKQREIIAIGRWEDALCKGADILAAVISQLSAWDQDYRVTVVGTGVDEVRRGVASTAAQRTSFLGETSFESLQTLIARARILLVPSRFESFSFVTAEALCAGTSAVTTPIESLSYMTGAGEWGTLARDFTPAAVTAALLTEIQQWEIGRRTPLEIATYWRSRLSPDAMLQHWINLLNELSSDKASQHDRC